jgi:hypothetical protein
MQTVDEIHKDIETKIALAADLLKDPGKTDCLPELRSVLVEALRLVDREQETLARLKLKALEHELRRQFRRQYMADYMKGYRTAHPRKNRGDYWRKRLAARKAANGSAP